jgi:hypothetical protein
MSPNLLITSYGNPCLTKYKTPPPSIFNFVFKEKININKITKQNFLEILYRSEPKF